MNKGGHVWYLWLTYLVFSSFFDRSSNWISSEAKDSNFIRLVRNILEYQPPPPSYHFRFNMGPLWLSRFPCWEGKVQLLFRGVNPFPGFLRYNLLVINSLDGQLQISYCSKMGRKNILQRSRICENSCKISFGILDSLILFRLHTVTWGNGSLYKERNRHRS